MCAVEDGRGVVFRRLNVGALLSLINSIQYNVLYYLSYNIHAKGRVGRAREKDLWDLNFTTCGNACAQVNMILVLECVQPKVCN